MELIHNKMKIVEKGKLVAGEIVTFAFIFIAIFILYWFFGIFLEACF